MDVSKKKPHGNKKTPVVENEVEDMRKYKGKKPKITDYPKDITETFEEIEEDVISVKEGTGSYNIVFKDPYHHAYIEGPGLPKELTGSYTTFEKAKTALDNWLLTKGK